MKVMFIIENPENKFVEIVKLKSFKDYDDFLNKYKQYKGKAEKLGEISNKEGKKEQLEHLYCDVFLVREEEIGDKDLFDKWKLDAKKTMNEENLESINRVLKNLRNKMVSEELSEEFEIN